MSDYYLIARKRWWIPEWFYAWFNQQFGNKLGTQQPWRWMLHVELTEFEQYRNKKGGSQ